MRRVVIYGVGWLAAATVAVLLAWQGVGRVGTNVTDRHAAPLTAEQARRQLERVINTAGEPGPPGGDPAGGPGATAPGSSPGTGPGSGGGGGGRPPTATTAATTPGPGTTNSTSSGPTATATTGPGSSTTAPPSGATETRTYSLVGGSTTLRYSPSGVTVVVANPNQGFSVDVDDRGGGRVRVRFDSDSHRSQVEAWWDGGPRDEVREEGDDDDDGD